LIKGEEVMSEPVSFRPIDAVRVYAVEDVAPGMGPENVSPVVGPLIEGLDTALAGAGRPALEPAIFWYEPVLGTDELSVHVSYLAEPEPHAGAGYDVVELPPIPTAATIIHRGDMSGIGETWMSLVDRLVADGYRMTGANREVYLHAVDHIPGPDWITELQVPVERV
jgi:hypothetical protein